MSGTAFAPSMRFESGARLPAGWGCLPRRRGRRSIGPVAIEADDTPFDTPGGPDDAGVFRDRIVDPARSAVINMNFADAEPPIADSGHLVC